MAKVSKHEKAIEVYNKLSEIPGGLETAAKHYGLARWYFKAQLSNVATDKETLNKMVKSMAHAARVCAEQTAITAMNIKQTTDEEF